MHRPCISAAGGYCMLGSGKKSSLFDSYVFRLSRTPPLSTTYGFETVAALGVCIRAMVEAIIDIIRLVLVGILDRKSVVFGEPT